MHAPNKNCMRHIYRTIISTIITISLAVTILPYNVQAASSSQIRKEIDKLKIEQENIQTQIEDVKQQYQENRDEIYGIVDKKNLIDREIGLLHAEINNINDLIAAYNSLIADKQEELDEAIRKYEQLNEENKVRIRAIEEGGTLSYWEVVFQATSFSNLLDNLAMMEEIAESDNKRLETMNQAAKQVEQAQQELIIEKEEQEELRETLNTKQNELEEKRKESDEILQELVSKEMELEELRINLENEDEALLAQISEMETEYTRAKEEEYLAWLAWQAEQEALKKQEQESSNPSNSNNSSNTSNSVIIGNDWIRPCNYVRISSPFGQRESPTTGASTNHNGVDLAAPSGTPIYASRGGTVTIARWSDSAGYYVTISHGDGFSSIYMHMTNFIVAAGQKVNQGQVIGYVGSTGISTGNHLHFGITYGGAYVNPCSYVNLY